MKSLAFTSSLFTHKKTNYNKDTNHDHQPWPPCNKSPTNCDGRHAITDEDGAIVDFSSEVGLTKSDRLLFSPGHGAKSIMEEALLNKKNNTTAAIKIESFALLNKKYNTGGIKIGSFEGGVAVAMESRDPYRDFRASMEQMVAAHGVKDWEWMQEMLAWYLRANGGATHGAILGAFVDVLVNLTITKSESCGCDLSKSDHIVSSSSCSSNCSCFSFEIEEKCENEKPHNN